MHQKIQEKTLTLLINQNRVSGEYRHTDYDLEVKINEPYSYFTGGSHIFCLARKHMNFKERGKDSATRVLTSLYLLSDYVENNQEFLTSELAKLEETIQLLAKSYLDYSNFQIQKEECKKELYYYDPIQYQKNLSKLKRAHQKWKEQVGEIFTGFFEGSFPMTISYENERQVVELLGSDWVREVFGRSR